VVGDNVPGEGVRDATELSLSSVAMGVGTAAQAERLRALGCKRAQGEWFAPPLPAAQAEAWATRCVGSA
jgi:EAL domain-containing protein (putative c-di-GMP-specific phosphodiesterase class I)